MVLAGGYYVPSGEKVYVYNDDIFLHANWFLMSFILMVLWGQNRRIPTPAQVVSDFYRLKPAYVPSVVPVASNAVSRLN